MQSNLDLNKEISFESFKGQILDDYKLIVTSREASLLGRREVLSGKAKFGIFGDGKELPQIALAKVFQNGDFRSGYYRDQTFMMAINELNPKQLFSALYANTDINEEPMSAGRQMGAHFNTVSLNEDGSWKDLVNQKNSSSDVSCTASQMPRLLGLAQASKLYRKFTTKNKFSKNGNEIAWGTIGNASTSEGIFFEVLNAAGVHQVPMVISVWDDDYGISVENKDQTIKQSISEALSGFQRSNKSEGFEILSVNGWDYPNLINTYQKANDIAREQHIPVLIHVKELTQPIGHSSSGSHERYKSEERLIWEKNNDCNLKMREWILNNNIATELELENIEKTSKEEIKIAKAEAWNTYQKPIIKSRLTLLELLSSLNDEFKEFGINDITQNLERIKEPNNKDLLSTSRKILRILVHQKSDNINFLKEWINKFSSLNQKKYSSKLYNESSSNAAGVKEIKPLYGNSKKVDGRIVLRNNFKELLSLYDNLLIFGEDSGKIGDVNQGLEGLQEIYGEERVGDRGIREASIIGEGIGLSLRGFRPIAEIQYLDYILYGLQILSDDLATLHYRTFGRQIAPLIIRTRLQCDEPAILIESLNGYRLKEKQPTNLSKFTVLLGKSEVLRKGKDISIVSYGSTLRLVEKAAIELEQFNIDVEVIDLQTLIPFDTENIIRESLKKTSRLLIVDEDLPGGASAYILQKIIEDQKAFNLLDSNPITLTAKEHRTAYGSDGDYFSKPSIDDIFEKSYEIMNEYDPKNYPEIF